MSIGKHLEPKRFSSKFFNVMVISRVFLVVDIVLGNTGYLLVTFVSISKMIFSQFVLYPSLVG